MNLPQHLITLCTLFTILPSVLASPMLLTLPNIPNAVPSQTLNNTNSAVGQLAHLSPLSHWKTTWRISNTLSLSIKVGDWALTPASTVQVLDAAKSGVGKKVVSALLDAKFTQKTGSLMDTMVFAIAPYKKNGLLSWGDVMQVLGTSGLPRFFQEDFGEAEMWRSVTFDVDDRERGTIGWGYVRKWWMVDLNAGGGENGTVVERREGSPKEVVE